MYSSYMMLNYDTPLYRPPSESNSLIFQVTLGCSFNKCSFCDMYRSKKYVERSWDQIKSEIDMMSKIDPDAKRIFLADGDALNLETEYLIKIISYIRLKFPNVKRISSYAMPMNVLKKTPIELASMNKAGLDMLYIGVESGSDLVLKKVTKGALGDTIIRAVKKAKNARYMISCMIILGLGGKKYTLDHINGTARVISACAPDYVGALTLYLENGIKEEFLDKYGGEFERISDADALDELERLVFAINVKSNVVFRANHGSNAFYVKGTFPAEKNSMLEQIAHMKKNPQLARPQGLRGF
ncbi:MAG: radical SAM protein [Cenarchaeum symbiont of Oopsacas minuta]|nr:radical SAM protein [Cenarchaeum symbiont of Oopsacas minuta]